MIRLVGVKSIHLGSGTGNGSGNSTTRLTDHADTASISSEGSTGALMHLHSLHAGSFATVDSGQQDSDWRTECISQPESQVAARHADMDIAGLDRLSTTKTAPMRRIKSRAGYGRDITSL